MNQRFDNARLSSEITFVSADNEVIATPVRLGTSAEIGAARPLFRIDPAGFPGLPRLQLAILRRAAGHVRPGGRLVYATCTLRREENEEVALAFGRDGAAFTLRDALPGLSGQDGFLRLLPPRHGTDGFFAAAWVRDG